MERRVWRVVYHDYIFFQMKLSKREKVPKSTLPNSTKAIMKIEASLDVETKFRHKLDNERFYKL